MKIKKQVMGYVETNTYYLEKEGQILVIDPCIDPHENATRLLQPLEGKEVVGIVLTHGHFDHISGIDAVVEKYHCPVYVFHEESHYLKNPQHNLSNMTPESVSVKSDFTTYRCEPQEIGVFRFDVMKTPGHTSGSVSLIFGDDIICGDFIFKQSIGRTDLPTGSDKAMRTSILEFVEKYKDTPIYLYPGHGDITTLEEELKHNPFIKQAMKG